MNVELITSLLNADSKLIWAAVLLSVVSASVGYFFKRRETKDKLKAEYDHAQRVSVRSHIGKYSGRMVVAANALSNRFWNIYQNHKHGWLTANNEVDKSGYYFLSSFFRLMNLLCLARQFEKEYVYIDSRFGLKEDFIFLNYLEAFNWALTDVALFKNLNYPHEFERDHFFSDNLRMACDKLWNEDQFIAFENVSHKIRDDRSFDTILQYFNGLSPKENRYRWDRLVVLHLILMLFLNRFGYKTHHSSLFAQIRAISKIRNPHVLKNLFIWMRKLRLVNSFSEIMIYMIIGQKIIWKWIKGDFPKKTDPVI